MILVLLSMGVLSASEQIITPVPQKLDVNLPLARLGRSLFFDPILSIDRTISCASCHNPDVSGVDGAPVSTGVHGLKGSMNAPTVFNAVFNFRQFWNGRAKTLEEQALGPIQNPVEMAMDIPMLEERINGSQKYRELFRDVMGVANIQAYHVAKAITEYEKTLITPDSLFDQYLKGEANLPEDALRGYLRFKQIGCINCHNGVNIGGNSFQKIGIIYPMDINPKATDRFHVTGLEEDRHVFKVPSLRNVALTAPYFHDGRVDTLDEAVRLMARHNLGRSLGPGDTADIVAFLKTLTGIYQDRTN